MILRPRRRHRRLTAHPRETVVDDPQPSGVSMPTPMLELEQAPDGGPRHQELEAASIALRQCRILRDKSLGKMEIAISPR